MRNKYLLVAAILLSIITIIFIYINDDQRILDNATQDRQEFVEELDTVIVSDENQNSIDSIMIEKLQTEIKVRENNVKRMKSCRDINSLYEWTLTQPIDCSNIPVLLQPEDLFYGLKKSDNPYVSQKEENHYHPWAGGILATDIATWFRAEIYAPDYLNQVKMYTVEVLHDTRIDANGTQIEWPLWNYLKLSWIDSGLEYHWILAHVETKLQTGDIVYTGQRIWQMDLSWYTTGYHLHQELWLKTWEDWRNISYTGRSRALINARNHTYDNDGIDAPIYFTHYDLWDVNQNDSTPCIWASGVDLCKLAQTGIQSVAITVDIRNLYGIKLKDTVTLRHVDTWTEYEVQVHDEKASRFRTNCYRDKGQYCNKWDIAHFNWVSNNWMNPWDYLIIK